MVILLVWDTIKLPRAESTCVALVFGSISSFGINHNCNALPLLISSIGILVCLPTISIQHKESALYLCQLQNVKPALSTAVFRSGFMDFLLAANGLLLLYIAIKLFNMYYSDDWKGKVSTTVFSFSFSHRHYISS
ncbi:hypothetical protein RHGRI_000481 [Rhododendron griersonianum]|uniref:H(+)-exporting diphosphatase n=1 Tax=Rhododendron griersonianum TaxID=479676 RepID=A0AAV6LJT2_9ERIC|nr:hypothetical protein RHGRI_000481 [Rhododendron griersonianum]